MLFLDIGLYVTLCCLFAFACRGIVASQPLHDSVAPDVNRGRIGSIADYDPLNNQWGSMAQGYTPATAANISYSNINNNHLRKLVAGYLFVSRHLLLKVYVLKES